MNNILKLSLSGRLIMGVLLASLFLVLLSSLSVSGGTAHAASGQDICQGAGGCGQGLSVGAAIASVSRILVFLAGAVAVIFIIIGGIRYASSNGDSSQIAAAKNTILYAVIGLIVAIAAFAIVDFILRTVK